MPISGLVVTLAELEVRRAAALTALADHPLITIGPQAGSRLPIVVETANEDIDRDIWEWLQSLPGVEQVDVAMIHFEKEQDAH
jgi:hypothetical protein